MKKAQPEGFLLDTNFLTESLSNLDRWCWIALGSSEGYDVLKLDVVIG